MHERVNHATLLGVLYLLGFLLVFLVNFVAPRLEVLLDSSDVRLDRGELLLALFYFDIQLFLEVLLDLFVVLLLVSRLNEVVLPSVAVRLRLLVPQFSNVRHLLQLAPHGRRHCHLVRLTQHLALGHLRFVLEDRFVQLLIIGALGHKTTRGVSSVVVGSPTELRLGIRHALLTAALHLLDLRVVPQLQGPLVVTTRALLVFPGLLLQSFFELCLGLSKSFHGHLRVLLVADFFVTPSCCVFLFPLF